jgi:hypothetical protein
VILRGIIRISCWCRREGERVTVGVAQFKYVLYLLKQLSIDDIIALWLSESVVECCTAIGGPSLEAF